MKLIEGLHVVAQTVCCLVLLHGKNIQLDNAVYSVTDDRDYNISSPGFPKCCKPGNLKYLLLKTTDVIHLKYWKLLFTDLDLPPGSRLVIYGLKKPHSQKKEIDAARYQNGAWIRPTIIYDGYAISIEFYPPSEYNADKSITFVGFRGTCWLSNDSWQLEKPFSTCPPIGNLMEGGRLIVTSSDIPLGAQHNTLHCIWQLKPLPDSDLQIFITIEYLHDGYYVAVHRGLSSIGPILFTASNVYNHSHSPTFTSREGFYVQLVKPMERGEFSMTYGVKKALVVGNRCEIRPHGISIIGFTCEEDDKDICIPVQKKCDGIVDCPQGSDEMPGTCGAPVPNDDKSSTASGYCLLGKCKDGRCPQSIHEKCPEDECAPRRRRCPGTLVCVIEKYESCPSELHKPLRYFFIGMSLVLILPGCLCCVYYKYRQKHKRQTTPSAGTNQGLRHSLITCCCNRTGQLNDAAIALNDVTNVQPEVSGHGNSYPHALTDFPVVEGPNDFGASNAFDEVMTSHSWAVPESGLNDAAQPNDLSALPSYADAMESQAITYPPDFHSNNTTTVEATEINGDSVPPTYDDVMNDTTTSPPLEVSVIPQPDGLSAPPAYDDIMAGLSMITTEPEPPPPYSAQAETVI